MHILCSTKLCVSKRLLCYVVLIKTIPLLLGTDQGRSTPLLLKTELHEAFAHRHFAIPTRFPSLRNYSNATPRQTFWRNSIALFDFFPTEAAFPTVSPLTNAGKASVVQPLAHGFLMVIT